MFYWDTRIAEAHVKNRLKGLGFPKVAVYVVGCVTHAKDVLAGELGDRSTGVFRKVVELLDGFWTQYPRSMQPDLIEWLVLEAADLLPGEEGVSSGSEDYLVWGTAYGFSLVKRNKYDKDTAVEALAAVDRAYWAVCSLTHEDRSGLTEVDTRAIEMNSPICKSEIEFQLAYLAALEDIQGQPPLYGTIVQQMRSGH